MVMVKGSQIINGFTQNCNGEIKVPAEYHSPFYTDLLIFVKMKYENVDYFAFALPCSIETVDMRPNVGYLNLNLSKIQVGRDKIEEFHQIILHELMHILAFSPQLYNFFPLNIEAIQRVQTNLEVESSLTDMIVTPKVLETARGHFGCEEIEGVPL
jgi:hypothetical protein